MSRWKRSALLTLVSMAALGLPLLAQADCSITGNVSAEMNNQNPEMGTWMYTMVVTWETGTMYGLSHFNLLVDIMGGTCLCEDVTDAIVMVNPAGTSDGVTSGPMGGDPCTLDWNTYLVCDGDPSIPGVDGIILKWEPDESLGCEPDVAGTVSVVFYSDLAPVPVDEDLISMSDKAGLTYCFGHVTGVFPGLACDPVPAEGTSWGSLKGDYR